MVAMVHFLTMGALLSIEACLSWFTWRRASLAGTPGLPGIPGLPGRDGRDGDKGDKGVAGEVLGRGHEPDQGQKGDAGMKGAVGKQGRSGVRGEMGPSGPEGPQGEPGDSGSMVSLHRSAFSVARGTVSFPDKSSPIRFTSVITDINKDYNTESGRFRCPIQGTYYFVFHASAEEKLCLQIKLDGTTLSSFCDYFYTKTRQVSTGGVAVYLRKDQEVWLEATEHNSLTGKPEGNSIFSGFLLHHH
ncbi:complement C1q subcomponent subunit C isoform X2 [Esox lucius]|uniref:Complement component 1, q subcomponent, C chain n=2 Tax=Esox lucius TaxID=8010 RepID=A0AAY5L148_ESOLU|nr:complement C1q subcomponent subunit C isoform X1 [Esox lucius]XP_034148998.1 complement C1q subcomponent subunit C isoform X2 [Esox lucius]